MTIKKSFKYILPIILTFIINSCVEKYWPELNSSENNLLVIEGMISNQPGPYLINISLTSPIDTITQRPASNYTVEILDNRGNSETLQEIRDGVYSTSTNGIQGLIGRKYKININSPKGQNYASDFVELLPPTEIKSFYPVIESKPTLDAEIEDLGYQFYIDTYESSVDSSFFLWRLEQTYEYHSDYTADYIMKARDSVLRETTNEEAKSYAKCWMTENVMQIFTYNTSILSSSALNRFPLNFVNTHTRALSVRYSLLVNQLTINKEAYHFWNSIENMNSNQGSMYTRQPYQIRGNLYNVDNPDEVVLGYFLVAGSDTERIYVNRLPKPYNYYYDICVPSEADVQRTTNFWWRFNESGILPDYDKLFNYYGMGYGTFLPNQSCIDCTLKGGVNVKPDFWIDE